MIGVPVVMVVASVVSSWTKVDWIVWTCVSAGIPAALAQTPV